MSEALKSIAARYHAALKVAEAFTSDPEDRPSVSDIWLYKLEDAVCENVKYPNRSMYYKNGEYDPFLLYAHASCLQTKEDVGNAPDDVLLEALGLGTVENWGWLRFMVRDFAWFTLLAANWGLPAMRTDYGGHAGATEAANEGERRAEVSLHFIDLMRERGFDVLGEVRAPVEAYKQAHKLSEEDFIKWLRGHNQWVYFVYTCQSVAIRPEAKGGFGEVGYSGEHRIQYRSEIRAAAERRRRNWDRPRTCGCEG
jgi:hypothetical protein